MADNDDMRITRRTALAGASGLAATAVLGAAMTENEKMPIVYLPHGGGPWPFMRQPMGEPESLARMTKYLQGLAALPAKKPEALLVVSAHWEEPVATVMTNERPPMLYDYSGFDKETYELQWPAHGAPRVASRIRSLLKAAKIESSENSARGFDHGTFVPMMLTYPKADIPTLQLSLVRGLDPALHLAIGRALAPLADEGVYIIGSGMSFHNMRAFMRGGGDRTVGRPFDDWLAETVAAEPAERASRLAAWDSAPGARDAHPREEHLMPLMVVAGAAEQRVGSVPYRDTLMGAHILAAHFV